MEGKEEEEKGSMKGLWITYIPPRCFTESEGSILHSINGDFCLLHQ